MLDCPNFGLAVQETLIHRTGYCEGSNEIVTEFGEKKSHYPSKSGTASIQCRSDLRPTRWVIAFQGTRPAFVTSPAEGSMESHRSWWAVHRWKKTRPGSNHEMVRHTSLVSEFQYGVAYFFPLSLKFNAT